MKNSATKNFVRDVKIALIHRNSSMAAWARTNGFPKNTVSLAIRGLRNGKRSRAIREKLEDLIHA